MDLQQHFSFLLKPLPLPRQGLSFVAAKMPKFTQNSPARLPDWSDAGLMAFRVKCSTPSEDGVPRKKRRREVIKITVHFCYDICRIAVRKDELLCRADKPPFF